MNKTPGAAMPSEFEVALDEFFTLAIGWGVQGREAKPVLEARARVVALYEAARTEAFREAASACKDVFDENVNGHNDWVRGQATGANTCMTAIWQLAGKP